MFAIFLGLLISFDYILCVLLIFPALCLYDRWNHRGRCCCVAFGSAKRTDNERTEGKQESPIRRILSVYYNLLHRFRYLWLVVVIGGTIFCCYEASRLSLPTTSEVRLLGKSNELEKVYSWKFNLLAGDLDRKAGSTVWVAWGLQPADTGNVNDPTVSSALVLDDTFNPSPEQNQLHLLKFCKDLFEQDYAAPVPWKICPMQLLDTWLAEQSASNASSVAYSTCGGASAVPVPQNNFDVCVIGFAQEQKNEDIYYRNGKVNIMRLVYRHIGVAYDSAFAVTDQGWNNLTSFVHKQNSDAPAGVNKVNRKTICTWRRLTI
jgi:hypothetical protein